MEIFDISAQISSDLDVFPGDVNFQLNTNMSHNNKDHLQLSSILTTLHLGSHADAPIHYHEQGDTIEQVDLATYLGMAQVIDCSHLKESIGANDIKEKIECQRILLKTSSFNPFKWNSDFLNIDSGLVNYLSEKNVSLIGIDTPSVDPQDSKTLDAHQTCYQNNINIIEGLVLGKVSPGKYFFIGLPLKIKNADASPIRAVLVKGLKYES